MEAVESLESSSEEPSGVEEAAWHQRERVNWGDPPLHGEKKKI